MGQNRWKSWLLWTAVAGLALDLLIYGGAISLGESEVFEGFVQRFLEILALVGIINNPTNKTSL